MSEITVTVVYALPDRSTEISVRVPAGTTVAEAIERSEIASRLPAIDLAAAPLGIFGRRVSRDAAVAAGDRIEIYRPLSVDPKTARRRRASGR